MTEVAAAAVVLEDSLKRRYAYKLGLNVLGLPFTVGTQALIARLLGPLAYGSFSFLNNFFTYLVGFFDSGVSAGFYSKLSQRPGDRGLVRFVWGMAAVITVLVLLAVGLVISLGASETVWPDQQAAFIWMAAAWGLLTWYSQVISRTVDAYGLTVAGEVVRFQQKVLAFALVLLLVWAAWGRLAPIYFAQYVVLVFVCLAWAAVLRRHGHTPLPAEELGRQRIIDYGREFYAYSSPLIVLAIASLLSGVVGRWFLQRYAGSVQQGLFGLSAQIGALCFMVSSPMTTLFWREISRASGAEDLDQMRRLFRRTVMTLYVITAFLAVFVAFQAKNVTVLLGGAAFSAAAVPVAIMVFYPIHQTYGQLTGSFLLATGRTRLTRNLGVATMTVGLGLSWFVLAPSDEGGMGLGAAGLAAKMVAEQLVGVNLQLWFITRVLGLSFGSFLSHQAYALAAMVAVAGLSTWISGRYAGGALVSLVSTGVLYTGGVGALLFLFPSLMCMSREELSSRLSSAHGMLRAR